MNDVMRIKPRVHYDASKGCIPMPNGSMVVHPLDHTDTVRVSNTKPAMTSTVVHRYEDGSFETLNSIYVPR